MYRPAGWHPRCARNDEAHILPVSPCGRGWRGCAFRATEPGEGFMTRPSQATPHPHRSLRSLGTLSPKGKGKCESVSAEPSFRPSQRVRPEVAGPMTGSARAGIHNHKRCRRISDTPGLWIPGSRVARPGMTSRSRDASFLFPPHTSKASGGEGSRVGGVFIAAFATAEFCRH